MKRNIYILVFQLIIIQGIAQNLVPNWSFEDTVGCPYLPGKIDLANFWYTSTDGSPEYYNSCSSLYGIPSNNWGNQNALTGQGYCGVYIYPTLKEYASIKIKDTLKSNHYYNIRFFVSLADDVNYAVDNIGIYFSPDSFHVDTFINLPFIPQIENNSTNPLTNKNNWVEISGIYLASGNENYITIGNFNSDSTTDTVWVGGGVSNSAYYYIDDVSVTPCTNDTTIDTTFCSPDSIFVAGRYYSQTGTYYDTLTNSMGCDSLITTILYIDTGNITTIDTGICAGDSINLFGTWQSAQGSYNDTLQNQCGNDSIIRVNLTGTPIYSLNPNFS